jgi:Beta-lactamase enzyme family
MLEPMRQGRGLILISVSLGCLIAAAGIGRARSPHGSPPAWRPHIAEARRYASGRAGEVAFAVVNERGQISGIRMASTAPAASVFKVMLLVALLRERYPRPLSSRDRALLSPMIRRSDSTAASEVRNIVGRARIERVARISAMRDFRYDSIWGLSRTSPRDQAWFMYRLESYIPSRYVAYARYLLSHIIPVQRWGIGRVVPRGWRLFLKGGWGTGTGRVDHQVALLERNGQRVSLAIFTQFDPSHSYGKATLRGVAVRLLRGLAQ